MRETVTNVPSGYIMPQGLAPGVTVRHDVQTTATTAQVGASNFTLNPSPVLTSAFAIDASARAQSDFGLNRARSSPGRGVGSTDLQGYVPGTNTADIVIETFAEATSAWRNVWSFSGAGHFSSNVAIDGTSRLDGIPALVSSYDEDPLPAFGDWFYDLRVWDVTHLSVSEDFELGGPTLVARVYQPGFDEQRDSFASSLSLDFDFLAGTSYVVTSELRTNGFNGRQIDIFNTARLIDVALSNGAQLSSLSGHDYMATAPVPEPSTWALLLAGMLSIARLARQRRA
ncbi:MAG: PEP-CTERM sorting domain-containing protein [Caldimonas sp.]